MTSDLDIRPVRPADAAELAALLNAIIARGGTTAFEDPFTPEALAEQLLTGPQVICCFVAQDRASGALLGFQSLALWEGAPEAGLPEGGAMGDIATFTRVGLIQKGVGSALFAATRAEAAARNLTGINATIRADNAGGLAFYGRMGFVDHAVRHGVPLKDGTPVDRVSKRYVLAAAQA